MAKRVAVNGDVCIGCGYCTSVAAEIFAFGDEGKAEVILENGELPEDLEATAEAAATSCPVQAIVIE